MRRRLLAVGIAALLLALTFIGGQSEAVTVPDPPDVLKLQTIPVPKHEPMHVDPSLPNAYRLNPVTRPLST